MVELNRKQRALIEYRLDPKVFHGLRGPHAEVNKFTPQKMVLDLRDRFSLMALTDKVCGWCAVVVSLC